MGRAVLSPPIYLCALRISASELLAFGGGGGGREVMRFLLPFHIASGDVLLTESYS